jgi:hypothetical protein
MFKELIVAEAYKLRIIVEFFDTFPIAFFHNGVGGLLGFI